MNNYLVHISTILFLLFLISPLEASKEINLFECNFMENAHQGQIEITLNQSDEFHSTETLKFGFNQELGRTAGANGNFSNNAFNKLIGMFEPDGLRYPGGTPANYFNWENEKLNVSAIDAYANKHIQSLLKRIERENKGKVPSVKLFPFLNLANQYKFSPFIVLNMFDTDKKIIAAIEKVKAANETVVYWELGNEVAYKNYHNIVKMSDGRKWSYEVYAQKVNKVSQYIKKRYPYDKVGVVASEIAEWRNPNAVSTSNAEEYRRSWDVGILAAMKNVDAVIFHPYVIAQKKQIEQVEMKCAGNMKPDLQLRTFAWILSNINHLPGLYVNRANNRFPGKDIWLTEFGIIGDESSGIESKVKRQNGLRVLSMAGLYLSWLQEFPKVNVMHTHGLFDGYNWAHIVYPDFSLTANGVAYVFIKKFLDEVEEIAPIVIKGGKPYQGIDRYEDMTLNQVFGLAGNNSVTGVDSMILVNSSNYTLNLELPWKAYSKVEKEFDWGSVIKPGEFYKSNTIATRPIAAKNVDVSPRSITIYRSK